LIPTNRAYLSKRDDQTRHFGAPECVELVLIDDQGMHACKQVGRQVRSGRSVEHDRHAAIKGDARGRLIDFKWDFKLQEQRLSGANGRGMFRDPGGIHRVIRTGSHHDVVLAVRVDGNDPDSSVLAHPHIESITVHAGFLEGLARKAPAIVIADATEKIDLRTETRRCDGLVGSFAASESLERAAEHRLARHRKARGLNDEVQVDGTKHANAGGSLHHRNIAYHALSFMSRTSLLCVSLFTVCLVRSLAAQQAPDRDALMKQVIREENQVAPQVVRDLARPADEQALKDLIRACKLFDQARALSNAYGQFTVFAQKRELVEKAVDFLHEEVKDRKTALGQYAVASLGRLMPESRLALIEIASKEKDENLRARAIGPLLDHLAEHPTKAGLELLLDGFELRLSGSGAKFCATLAAFPLTDYRRILEKRLNDRKYSVVRKQLILSTLAQPPFPALRDLAEACLMDENQGVARAALRAMVAHGGELSGAFWKKLSTADDPALRLEVMVLRARQGLGRASVEKDIQAWVGSRDAVRRQAAARALALKPGPEAVQRLAQLLQDNQLPVRLEAARSLGAVRRTDALEILITQAEHPSRLTADLVQRTLTALTDQEFGPTVSTWTRWWKDHQAEFAMPNAEIVTQRLIELRSPVDEDERTGASFWGLPIVSRRVVFVLDTSGSMLAKFAMASKYGATKGTRLSAAKAQLIGALRMLPDGTLFNIITFDTRGDRWKEDMVVLGDATRVESRKWVEGLRTRGATNVFDALDKAFALKDVDTIYLLSDGRPYGGKIDDPLLLRDEIKAWNATRRIPIHAVSLGGDVVLLRRLAEDSGGVFRLVK
jgi:HEAT repeat protein